MTVDQVQMLSRAAVVAQQHQRQQQNSVVSESPFHPHSGTQFVAPAPYPGNEHIYIRTRTPPFLAPSDVLDVKPPIHLMEPLSFRYRQPPSLLKSFNPPSAPPHQHQPPPPTLPPPQHSQQQHQPHHSQQSQHLPSLSAYLNFDLLVEDNRIGGLVGAASSPSPRHGRSTHLANSDSGLPLPPPASTEHSTAVRALMDVSLSTSSAAEGIEGVSQMPEPRTVPGTTFKVSSGQSDAEKRKKFLERNRQAALRCRQRKKHYMAQLQHRLEQLTTSNQHLEAQVTVLKAEVERLLGHINCMKSR